MTMISDDERREVADGLRYQVKKLGPKMDTHEFANYCADVVDPDCELRWDKMMLHLADLIDRETCYDTEDKDSTSFTCSACGFSESKLIVQPFTLTFSKVKPNYYFCPKCGKAIKRG